MAKYELNRLKGTEIEQLFYESFECLFNHIQIRNKLYFFAIEDHAHQCKVHLKEVVLPTNANEKIKDSNMLTIDIGDSKKHSKSKLLGAVILTGAHEQQEWTL